MWWFCPRSQASSITYHDSRSSMNKAEKVTIIGIPVDFNIYISKNPKDVHLSEVHFITNSKLFKYKVQITKVVDFVSCVLFLIQLRKYSSIFLSTCVLFADVHL